MGKSLWRVSFGGTNLSNLRYYALDTRCIAPIYGIRGVPCPPIVSVNWTRDRAPGTPRCRGGLGERGSSRR